MSGQGGATPLRLGASPVEISRVVLGCMWPDGLSEPEIHRIVHAAHDAGITAFDTAPLYGFHAQEAILGRALRDRRSRVQILTKAGLRWDDHHGDVLFEFTDAAGQRRAVRRDSRPESLVAEVEASLKRLGTDVIDLIQIHHPDRHTRVEASVEALATLVAQGKVRAIGVSNSSPDQLTTAIRALAGTAPLAALQCEYSLLQRWPEVSLVPICRAHGVAVLAYSPLAKGVLALGGHRAADGSRYGHPLARPLIARVVRQALAPLAERHRADVGQVALAWVLGEARQAVVVGARSAAQARQNAAAMQVVLTADEVRATREAFAKLDAPLTALERGLGLPVVARVDRLAGKVLRKIRSAASGQ